MELEIIAFLISVAITTVSSQVQNVRIPPGALVEFGMYLLLLVKGIAGLRFLRFFSKWPK